MMDELELLKRDWKKQENHLPKLQADTLYGMVHMRSSSLTKKILIIAVVEFVFWITLTLITATESSLENLRKLHFYTVNIVLNILNFSILFTFIYLFYRNYRDIRTTDSTKQLMHKILKVRKTVNGYVIYNLAMAFVSTIMIMTAMYFYDPTVKKILEISQSSESNLSAWGVLLISALIIIVLLVVFWMFYKLLYGILLKRLLKNYKELNKLDFTDE